MKIHLLNHTNHIDHDTELYLDTAYHLNLSSKYFFLATLTIVLYCTVLYSLNPILVSGHGFTQFFIKQSVFIFLEIIKAPDIQGLYGFSFLQIFFSEIEDLKQFSTVSKKTLKEIS